MQRLASLGTAALAAAALSAWAAPAAAQSTDVGTRIQFAMTDMVGPLLLAVALLCSIAGLILFAKGLLKLREAGQGQGAVGSAMVNIAAGAILILLPEVSGIGMSTVLGTNSLFGITSSDLSTANAAFDGQQGISRSGSVAGTLGGLGTVTAPKDCINNAGGDAVPCMAKNIAKNVVPVGIIATFAFVYLAGMWGFGTSLLDLARHSGERGGGGAPPGFWTKVIASVLMMGGPPAFLAFSRSVMGNDSTISLNGLNQGSSLLTYTLASANVFQQYNELIGHLFTILALFGVIVFCRGLFVLRGAAEQRGNATYGHSVVYLVAGALLANAKLSTCAILSTISGFGGAAMVGFCVGS